MQPKPNTSPAAALFFVAFLIIGYLFVLNLFVAVVIDTFYQKKEKLLRNHELTPKQRDYCEVMIKSYNSYPLKSNEEVGSSKFERWSRIITESKKFDIFILWCIILNTICLALSWYGRPDKVTFVLNVLNYFFTLIYTAECVIKITAMRSDYFRDGWNIFDFIIVVSAWSGIIALEVFSIDIGPVTTVIRAFRISRIIKIIGKLPGLQQILQTFIISIPELANVGGLLTLFIYLYSVLGVFSFAGVKLNNELNDHANFQSFGVAAITLFRIATGEAW